MYLRSCLWATICIFIAGTALPAQETNTDSLAPVPQITNSQTGKPIELDLFVDKLVDDDVIILGEQHNNDSGHEFQIGVIKALVEKGLDVIVSMEQFERDVQGALNDYLAGRITEEEFLASSRPWKNYSKHYRPIIEFAKENRLPVLAGNVPSSLASSISKDERISAGQRVFLPRTTTAPQNDYWANFEATMKDHVGNDGANKLKRFYAAQCIKDDAMAETITDYLAANKHRPKIVVHLCGHFHSDYGLGTVARIAQRKPLVRFTVVTMETTPDSGKLESDTVRVRAHYIFWTVENKTESQNDKNPGDSQEEKDAQEPRFVVKQNDFGEEANWTIGYVGKCTRNWSQ